MIRILLALALLVPGVAWADAFSSVAPSAPPDGSTITVNGGKLTANNTGCSSNCTFTTPAITGGTISGADVSQAPAVATGGNTSRTLGDRAAERVNILDYGVSAAAADNATALQAAINAAVAAHKTLYIPVGSSCYKYTAPLTVAGDLSIVGDAVTENWANGINVPLGSPALLGSVLCPTSNGSDAVDITGTSRGVSIENLGILFQTPYNGTGDGIHYIPGTTTGGYFQGLSGAVWKNVKVFGHDGSHYAVNLTNPIYDTFVDVFGYGGGGVKLYGGGVGDYGNLVFVHPYFQVIAGGSANGFDLRGAGLTNSNLNLITMIRPQAITNGGGMSYSPAPPAISTSSQYVWYQDNNVKAIRLVSPDFESTVGSGVQFVANNSNTYDYETTLGAGADVVLSLSGTPTHQATFGSGQRVTSGTYTGLTSGVLLFDEFFPTANVSTVLGSAGATAPVLATGAPDTPYTITASISGSTVTVTATSQTIVNGQYLRVPGLPYGFPLTFSSGTAGGAGTYTSAYFIGTYPSGTYQVFIPNAGQSRTRYGYAYTAPANAQQSYVATGY